MGIKSFALFLIFFILSSFFLIFQKTNLSVKHYKSTKEPIMEFFDIKNYNITYNGVNAVLQAKIAKRYEDRDEMYHIYSSKEDRYKTEYLWANKGVLKDNILKLFGDVLYKTNKNRTLRSNIVIYNLKKDILSSALPFTATFENSIIKGSSFIFYKKDRKLTAENVKASIDMDKELIR